MPRTSPVSTTVRPPKRRRLPLLARAAVLALAATGTVVALNASGSSQAAELPNGFKSVGYMPSWAGSAAAIQYGKLTHINYAFALPNANGTLQPLENPSKLQQIVS